MHRALLLGFLILAAPPSAADEPKNKTDPKPAQAPNYYPIRAGNEWHFKVTVGDNTSKAVTRITKIETFDDVPLARLEATVGDKVVGVEHLRQTDEGIFRYRNNDQEITPPICLLKYPTKSGAKWNGPIVVGKEGGKYTAEATEVDVEVPAGKFKAMKVDVTIQQGDQKVNTVYWFVKDKGLVKQTLALPNLNLIMELEKTVVANPKK